MDDTSDPAVNALATLAKHSVNSRLQEKLGTDAIKHVFGCPISFNLIGQNRTPCMAIYRQQDRNRDRGQWVHENLATFKFDYFAPATPLMRLDRRWPVLHLVWQTIVGVCRVGKDPSCGDNAPVMTAGGLCYLIDASPVCDYSFVPGATKTYPFFRGTMQFVESVEPPAAFDPSDLSPFETLWTDWNLEPETNSEFEAQNKTELEQDD